MARRLGWFALGLLLLVPTPGAAVADEPPARDQVALDSQVCRNEAAAERSTASCTVLYAHLANDADRVPMNVEPPTPGCREGKALSAATALAHASVDLWAMPAPIAYQRPECRPLLVPQFGLADETRLDPRLPVTFHWFLRAEDPAPFVSVNGPLAGAMPCVEVRVSLQSGRFPGQGEVLASGSARRTVLTGGRDAAPPVPQQLDPCAEGALVEAQLPFLEVAPAHEFPVLLGELARPLPAREGFVVTVEWSEVRGGAEAMERSWTIQPVTDQRSRLVLPVAEPLRMTKPTVERFGQHHVLINASVASPWGTYDVDESSIRLDLLDSNGFAVPGASMVGPSITSGRGDGEDKFRPVNATWAWDFLRAQNRPGPFLARVVAENAQGTATIVREVEVDVPELLARESPGVPPLVAALAVLALLVRVRRI